MAAAKVSEKSTKTEIWNAYNQLVDELQNKPISVSEDPVKLQKMTAAMNEAKAALMRQFEATIERLGTVQEAYHEADQDLVRRKAAAIDALEQNKRELQISIETIKKHWETEKADRESQRQREEETYAYNLTRKRRDDEEAYTQKAKEREAKLTAHETALDEREESVKDLSKQVDGFPRDTYCPRTLQFYH